MADKLTSQQAANELGYNIYHIYRLLQQGRMKGEKFGQTWMIPRAEVDRVKALQDDKGNLPKGALKP